MRTLVALSGGVDSSTVAHLLAKAGHDIVCVQLLLWNDPQAPASEQILTRKCCSAQAHARATKVAKDLGAEFHQVDVSSRFRECVVSSFLDDYERGMTPNPCVHCNRVLKFAALLELADEYKCESLATGHYARIVRNRNSGISELHEALDTTKDQSYYLYRLTQAELSRCLFPLGDFTKASVLSLARTMGIPLPQHYQESQDICFFPEKEPHAFLDRYLPKSPGFITDTSGSVLGKHRGLYHYTEGQRRGIGIGGSRIPLYVVAKDTEKNRLILGTKEEAAQCSLLANHLTWTTDALPISTPVRLECRIRALGKRYAAHCSHDGSSLACTFDEPVLGISPGQSLVLYRGKAILGGGIIT